MTTLLKKKRTYVIAVILCIIAGVVYFMYPIYNCAVYGLTEQENLPENLFLEIPFFVTPEKHLCVPCEVNDKTVNLYVDTKAVSLMKKDDIEKYGGVYFDKLPFASKNVRGEKFSIVFYKLPHFRIGTLSTTPLFNAIDKDNYLYPLIGEGVLGYNALGLCVWKFSLDDQKVKLFHPNDTVRFEQERSGFVKIEKGLKKNGITINIENLKKDLNLTLDLGNNVDILVDNEVAEALKKQYPYKKIRNLTLNNILKELIVFEDVSVIWNGIQINHCCIANNPDFAFDRSFIGSGLMHRFNFILEYENDNLYIKPCRYFEEKKSEPIVSVFGFGIKKREHSIQVNLLEEGGIAEKAGIELGDEVIGVDSCTFNPEHIKKEFIDYAQDKKEITIRIKDKGEIRLSPDN